MTVLHLQGVTDTNGDLHVHVGRPNTAVSVELRVPEEEMTQEQWAAKFVELASQVDPAVFERMPQQNVRDPFSEHP
jgi:hypothetical protein